MTGYLQVKDFTEICNGLEYSSWERRFLKPVAHPLSEDISGWSMSQIGQREVEI